MEQQPQKKRLKIFGVEFVYIYLFGIICAFIGWLAENIAMCAFIGIIDSRYHLLPFISPYALIAFAFHIVFGDPDDLALFGKKLFKKEAKNKKLKSNVSCLLIIWFMVGVGEIVVGSAWEILFGVSLWNYTGQPLTLTKYTGIIPILGYGTGAYLLFKFVYRPAINFFRQKVPFKVAKIICLTLGVAIVLDTVFMGVHIAIFGEAPIYWKIILR